jgi:mono/diheme cytochrome c family protein
VLKRFPIFLLPLIIGGAMLLLGQQRTAAGPFTADQAAQGRTQYETNCATCHLANLAGRNEAPQLAGSSFMNVWGSKSAGELISYIQAAMPPNSPGSLGANTYVNIAAFILESNSSPAGAQQLDSSISRLGWLRAAADVARALPRRRNPGVSPSKAR